MGVAAATTFALFDVLVPVVVVVVCVVMVVQAVVVAMLVPDVDGTLVPAVVLLAFASVATGVMNGSGWIY